LGKGNIIASLDLGTSKTCCMVGEITRSGDIDILGYGICESSGIKKGVVVNIDLAAQSIAKAVEIAEQMSNTNLSHVAVGISGDNISLVNNRGVVAIPKNESEITPQDVERVLQAAKIMAIPLEREIIDIIPREFIVDGYDGIKDPVGMAGSRLEVSACIVLGLLTSIQNIVKCVQRAGLSVESMILRPLAAAEMLVSEDEMDMGVVLIDVGAGTTEISVFQDGCIAAYDMIPIGGDLITNDIAIGLRLPYSYAEEIKCKYGCALMSMASENKDIEVYSLGESSSKKISQKELTAIIEPRVQEIISYIAKSIKEFGLKSIPPAGIVFTGGGLIHIDGALEMAKQLLGIPVRAGVTSSYGKDQTFTIALGLLNYLIKHRIFDANTFAKEKQPGYSILERIRKFFREYF